MTTHSQWDPSEDPDPQAHLYGISLWTHKPTYELCRCHSSRTVYSALCTDHPIKTLYTVCTHSNKSVCYNVYSGNRTVMNVKEQQSQSQRSWLTSIDLNLSLIQVLCVDVVWRMGPPSFWRKLNETKIEVQAKTSLTVKLPNTNLNAVSRTLTE